MVSVGAGVGVWMVENRTFGNSPLICGMPKGWKKANGERRVNAPAWSSNSRPPSLWGAGSQRRLRKRGRGQSLNPGGAGASEPSAFLDGGAVGVGRELRQAGLLGAGVVGEDRVLARGAGGAAGVQVTLLQGRGQLQVLLRSHKSHL